MSDDISFKVLKTEPPKKIYDKARKQFGEDAVDFNKGTTFTVGNTIYCHIDIPRDLLAHELTHVRQQTEMGWKKWWKKYFKDVDFRYSQEIEAYRKQYQWIKNNVKDKNLQNRYLVCYARSLSGKLYGNLKTYDEALKEIVY